MEDVYAKIMSVLDDYRTSAEIYRLLRPNNLRVLLNRLVEVGAVTVRPSKDRRVYAYCRTQDTITTEEVKKRFAEITESAKQGVVGARMVTFDSPEMREKLRETARISRRKTGKVHVSANWNFD